MIHYLLCGATLFAAASAQLSSNSSAFAINVDCACSELSQKLPDSVLVPSSENFTVETKNFWDVRSAVAPACMFFPTSADEVAEGVSVIASCDAQFAIRGGGHMNFPGSNSIEGGVLLALNKLSDMSVDEEESTISVGPGNKWVDVYGALDEYGLYTNGGRLKTIGVPGLTLIGGFHYFINKYGYTMDSVKSYDVVLGNGTQIVANSTSNCELFWALKGGAANFGIVTKFVLQAWKIPKISTTIQVYEEEHIPQFIEAASEMIVDDDGEVAAGSVLSINYNLTTGSLGASLLGVQEGTESPPSRFAPFSAIPSTMRLDNVTAPKVWHSDKESPNQMFRIQFAHHTVVATATDRLYEIVQAWKAAVAEIADVEGLYPTFVLNTMPKSAASVAKTNGVGNVWGLEDDESLIIWQLATGWANASDDLRITSWAKNFIEYHHSINQDLGVAHEFLYMGDAGEFQDPYLTFPAENVEKLRAVRTSYDPGHVFSKLNWGGFKLAVV
ncbi:putative fad binding domain-containing protein [Eutypa lata UCREL1]|uniref:Putative fad binding domain-containing protein n=1 Tax=Eutypa lata (strain UCR-EL1) TaxID=1287681 RepID=M7THS9_EUTLA|nr:putative fad binding domain-containing protein [Eutypa lata UCREL1]